MKRVISLFSGIGGIDLGFQQAGFDIIWANDKDAYACKTYKNNFSNTIIQSDIQAIDKQTIPSADIITAGFPCQPFSVMGYQRGFQDRRGNLFFQIADVISLVKPKCVFLENVENLLRHDKGRTFLVIYNTLVSLGYYVKYHVMNSKDYGNIPQNRSRIFIVAFSDYEAAERFVFPEKVSLQTDVDDIIDRSIKHDTVYYYEKNNKYFFELNNRIHKKTGIYRIDDSGVAMRQYSLCPTLKANMGTFHDRVPIIRDDFGIRKLTPYECLKFQGFPESFRFKGIPMNEAYKQIGNTVVVPVVKRIADNIFSLLCLGN